MDSLLASYASSEDDGEDEISHPPKPSSLSASGISPKSSSLSASGTPRSSSFFLRSLPPPRTSASSSSSSSSSPSSFLFSSLPPPKSLPPNHSLNDNNEQDDEGKPSMQLPSPYIFSSLPPPKASSFSTSSSLPAPKFQSGNQSDKLSLDKNHNKRIVHFTVPLNPSLLKSQDSDNDDDGEEDKQRKTTTDAAPFSFSKALSSMLPAPKNSLCIAPAQSSGASRRSSLQAEASSPKGAQESKAEQGVEIFGADQNMAGFYDTYGSYTGEQGASDYVNCTSVKGNWTGGVMDHGVVGSIDSTYATNPPITQWEQVDGNGVGYGSYMDNWSIVSQVARQSEVLDMRIITGKRGRTDIPTEIVEVKQDELMKNRPREDQAKLTGIAFGPTYQPVPSAKGKPSKLHKRKHQIGSLYYDLKQKEMELAERRSKGLLTKAETQAKYGW